MRSQRARQDTREAARKGRACGRWWPISALALCLLAPAGPTCAQRVDFAALARYGDACVKLKAAILASPDEDLPPVDTMVDWIAACNGNIPACQDTRKAIKASRTTSPLDCLGKVQSSEAASAAYSLYLDTTSALPRCISRRC